MASAAMNMPWPNVVGYLPAPASRDSCGAADLLEGQLFAYGVGAGIAIVEVSLSLVAQNSMSSSMCWVMKPSC